MYGRSEYSLPPSSASKSDISASPIRAAQRDDHHHSAAPTFNTAAARSNTSALPPRSAPSRPTLPTLAAGLRSPSPHEMPQADVPRGLFLRGDLPVQDQVDALKSALLVTMEEVDTLRRDVTVENGKLQLEFRRSVDMLLMASEASLQGRGSNSRAASAGAADGSAGTMSIGVAREMTSRLEYLEGTVRQLQLQQSSGAAMARLNGTTAASAEYAAAPVAVESALRRMAEFMDRADADIQAAAEVNNRAIAAWEQRFNALQREHEDALQRVTQQQQALEEALEVKTRALMSPGKEARMAGRTLDGTIDNLNGTSVDGGRGEARLTASSFVTLSQVSNIVNSQIVEVAALMDAEIAKMKESLATAKTERGNSSQKIDRISEVVAQLDEDTREMRQVTDQHLREITKTSATAEEFLKKIEKFVENFTLQESDTIRDEVLRLVNSDAAIAQRKIDDRHRRDQITAVKEDVIRTVTALERLQEEVTSVTTQQHTLYQEFQRTQHAMQAVQHKVDTEQRTEMKRMEQLQKSFFERQEQKLASDRHNMTMKMAEELRRMQDKHMEELTASETRRLDDVQLAAAQIREDFNNFVESQRREYQVTVSKIKEDFITATKQANDMLTRTMTAARDEQKRMTDRTLDDFRKLSTQKDDEVRRMQNQLNDTTAIVRDQTHFHNQRVGQLIEQAQARIDNAADDLKSQLNALVESEVREVVGTSLKTVERSLAHMSETTTRELATLRVTTESLRTTVQAMAQPANSIKAVDDRVDMLQRDIGELSQSIAQTHALETRLTARAREEARATIETSWMDLVRDVAAQLRGFDDVLREWRRELDRRGLEVDEIAARVERQNSTILNPPQQQQVTSQQPQSPAAASQGQAGQAFGVARGSGVAGATTPMSAVQASQNLMRQRQAATLSMALADQPYQQQQQQQLYGVPDARSVLDLISSPPQPEQQAQRTWGYGGPAPQQVQAAVPLTRQQPRQPSYRSTSSGSAVGFVLPSAPGGGGGQNTPSPASRGRPSDALQGAFDSF